MVRISVFNLGVSECGRLLIFVKGSCGEGKRMDATKQITA